jgi:hypothetical protein
MHFKAMNKKFAFIAVQKGQRKMVTKMDYKSLNAMIARSNL